MKETSEKIKNTIKTVTDDARTVMSDLLEGTPRPIMDRLSKRKTFILKQPIAKTVKERRE